jgi:quercetin dioxygenase-like cupin family protein
MKSFDWANIRKRRRMGMKPTQELTMNHQVKPATAAALLTPNPSNPCSALAGASEVILRNKGDMKWELMLPDLGKESPRFTILRVDPETDATTLMIEFPTAIHIPRHTHAKSETHFLLEGSHKFGRDEELFTVKAGGYFYMAGGIVHEAWVPAGARAIIILEDGWKVDWSEGGPTAADLGKSTPLSK